LCIPQAVKASPEEFRNVTLTPTLEVAIHVERHYSLRERSIKTTRLAFDILSLVKGSAKGNSDYQLSDL
jgi:hypothetical protein